MHIVGQDQEVQQPRLNFNDLDDVVCKECNSNKFTPVFIIKKVSALYSQSGKNEMMPVQLFECSKCGELIDMNIE